MCFNGNQKRLLPEKWLKKFKFSKYFYCFVRFTKILSSAYLAQPGSSMTIRKSSRSCSPNSSWPLFPNSCFICGKKKKKKISKSFSIDQLMSKSNEENTDTSRENATYGIDLMGLIRMVMAIPKAFKDLALQLISILPN